ncbi:MAG TPA: glycosyltransferase family 2 protein [Chloroflexota bacterium]|nr:glycosyltransferase family 2 protein [Chloroflexota bacterium]
MTSDRPTLSVIVPVFNEEECLPRLHDELRPVMESLGSSYEIIYVDDGSRDGSLDFLRTLAERESQVRVIRFRRNFGQTAALAAGMDQARGDILVFLDADLQNPPGEIPKLLAKLDEGYDVVSGWRKNRQDAALMRKFPSRLANALISWVSGVHLHDYGCTLKAYRRDVMENVRLYGEMHRFIPAYAFWAGANVTEIPVEHRARAAGYSKYGINRTVKVVLDLLTLKFLSSYSTTPIYLFGGMGAFSMLGAFAIWALVVYQRFFEQVRVNRNPLFILGFFFLLTGVLLITQGLLAELVMRTYHESQGKPPYVIREIIQKGAPRDVPSGEPELVEAGRVGRAPLG